MEKNPDVCDTSLSLGLHFKGRRGMSTDRPRKRNLSVKHEPPVSNPCLLEPSLMILGLPTGVYQSNPVKAEVKSSPEASLARSSSYSTSSLSKVMNEEAEEDEEGSARKKLRLTKEQSALLEDRFKEHSTLNPKQKQALAKQLNLRPRQVEVWFQNRRARTKMKQTEVDCEFLRRCCETLADENRRLQRELRELKAVKLAPPWCMQFQGAAPTVCPRCGRVTGACDASKAGPFTHPASC